MNGYGQTALHIAVLNGFDETVATLLRWNSDANAKTVTEVGSSGLLHWTPLMLAFGLRPEAENSEDWNSQTRIVDLLLASHADLNLKDHEDSPGLHYAIRTGQAQFAEQMGAAGSDVLAKDKRGTTALHHAARSNKLDMIKMMVHGGAAASAMDDSGKTCSTP